MFFFLATGPVSLQIDVVSNLPKKQDLVNEVREKFAQLRRLSVELQNALFRWILIRATTIQQLKSLAEHLKIIEPEFVLGFAVTRFIILYYFIIGWPLIGFLINKMTIAADAGLEKMIDARLGLELGKVQASIEGDHKVCLKFQQQLDFLENFISTLAEFLIPLNDNAVLLKEMGEPGFEFLYKWIAREVMDRSTVTKVEFCAKFLRVATSASTMSSSIPAAKSATVFVSEVARAGVMARAEARCEAIRTGTRAKYIADSGIDIKSDLFPLDIALFVESSLKRHCGFVSMMAEDITRILNELECPNEEEIQGLVQSFIEGSFNKAYRLIESDKLRE